MIDESSRGQFTADVWEFYALHGRRNLPWRFPEANGDYDVYKILVSEVMLQQTQAQRVIPKYNEFTRLFPDIDQLARAPQRVVLKAWSGLGYNRRAMYLRNSAIAIIENFGGTVPKTKHELLSLPGIGANTAGAIIAYAYNMPEVFIETNIRSVFIHHFFSEQINITDQSILELVQQTLPEAEPREWYWALMDYGTYLKRTQVNPSLRSKHYTKQSQFQGSTRQLRGQVLNLLRERNLTQSSLQRSIADDRLPKVLEDLLKEKLIEKSGNSFRL